jgi:hypothetical protein
MRQLNWRTVAVLAIGISLGVSMMATPAAGHVGGTVGHLWKKHIRPKADVRYANATPGTDKAKDADRLDGRDSTDFLRVTGKAADAEKLDSLDSTDFLRVTGKAADADKLDGLDSSAFDRKNQYPRVAISKGMRLGSTVPCVDGDDHCYLIASCDSGDVLATGGASSIDQGTDLEASVASSIGGPSSAYPVAWLVRWHNNSTADTVAVEAFCWRS